MPMKRRLRSRATDPRQIPLGLPPAERYTLFFAAMPPEAIARQVGQFAGQFKSRFELSSERPIPHVRLFGLGDYDFIPDETIAAVKPVASTIKAKSFDAVFDAVQPFDGPGQPLVLRCGKGLYGFVAVQNAIGNALAGAGADRPQFDSRFVPHMTIFDGGGEAPEMTLDRPIA